MAIDVDGWVKVMERIARDTYDGKIKRGELDEAHILNTYEELNKATETGYGKNWLKVDGATGAPAPEALKMQQNIYKFSGAKNFTMLEEINGLLTKDDKLANWPDFKASVLKLNNQYNVNYLQAEWQTARHSGYMANLWQEYLDNAGLFPNLEYRTQGDDRVREEHEKLDGTIAPINDGFWDSYYPPNGWRCRCFVVQTAAKPTAPGKMPEITPKDVLPEFKVNTGKSGQVFKEDAANQGKAHPYFMLMKQQPDLERKINKFIYKTLFFNAKQKLISKTANHKQLKNISFTVRGLKEAFNQPHRNYTDKNWLIEFVNTMIPASKYLGVVTDVKQNPMVKFIHVFETQINNEASYILIRELKSGDKQFYNISDSPKFKELAKKK